MHRACRYPLSGSVIVFRRSSDRSRPARPNRFPRTPSAGSCRAGRSDRTVPPAPSGFCVQHRTIVPIPGHLSRRSDRLRQPESPRSPMSSGPSGAGEVVRGIASLLACPIAAGATRGESSRLSRTMPLSVVRFRHESGDARRGVRIADCGDPFGPYESPIPCGTGVARGAASSRRPDRLTHRLDTPRRALRPTCEPRTVRSVATIHPAGLLARGRFRRSPWRRDPGGLLRAGQSAGLPRTPDRWGGAEP